MSGTDLLVKKKRLSFPSLGLWPASSANSRATGEMAKHQKISLGIELLAGTCVHRRRQFLLVGLLEISGV
jgi:hypothetical protein